MELKFQVFAFIMLFIPDFSIAHLYNEGIKQWYIFPRVENERMIPLTFHNGLSRLEFQTDNQKSRPYIIINNELYNICAEKKMKLSIKFGGSPTFSNCFYMPDSSDVYNLVLDLALFEEKSHSVFTVDGNTSITMVKLGAASRYSSYLVRTHSWNINDIKHCHHSSIVTPAWVNLVRMGDQNQMKEWYIRTRVENDKIISMTFENGHSELEFKTNNERALPYLWINNKWYYICVHRIKSSTLYIGSTAHCTPMYSNSVYILQLKESQLKKDKHSVWKTDGGISVTRLQFGASTRASLSSYFLKVNDSYANYNEICSSVRNYSTPRINPTTLRDHKHENQNDPKITCKKGYFPAEDTEELGCIDPCEKKKCNPSGTICVPLTAEIRLCICEENKIANFGSAAIYGCNEAMCGDGYAYFEEARACLFFSKEALPWIDADKACKKNNGKLFTIDHQAKHEAIISHITDTIWTGLNNMELRNATSLDITNFSEFNTDANHAMKDCISFKLDSSHGYRWNNEYCRNSHMFVCQENKEFLVMPLP